MTLAINSENDVHILFTVEELNFMIMEKILNKFPNLTHDSIQNIEPFKDNLMIKGIFRNSQIHFLGPIHEFGHVEEELLRAFGDNT